MSVREFDHGYWYALELKAFADSIGILAPPHMRKDEVERAIRHFLATGRIASMPRRAPGGVKDVERGLRLRLRVVRYTNDRATKDFLEREARKVAPGFKRRSGSRYRLNRWREAQLAAGKPITYRDVVREYVRLNRGEMPYARISHGRYINFTADFLANEPGATRTKAIAAWERLKRMDAPKTYRAWKSATARAARRAARRRRSR
jgi:hypothetical protein